MARSAKALLSLIAFGGVVALIVGYRAVSRPNYITANQATADKWLSNASSSAQNTTRVA